MAEIQETRHQRTRKATQRPDFQSKAMFRMGRLPDEEADPACREGLSHAGRFLYGVRRLRLTFFFLPALKLDVRSSRVNHFITVRSLCKRDFNSFFILVVPA